MMRKKDMLEALIDHYDNGNKSQFAKRIGISAQGLSTWIARDTFDAYVIYANCEGISADWLLSGEGSMTINPKSPNINTQNANATTTTHLENNLASYPAASEERPTAIRTTIEDPRGIPLIPFSAQAGSFVGERTAMLYDCERYVVPAFNGADFLMTVNGKSMTPSLQSGDIVACQRVGLDNLFFQWGKIYVLDTDQGALVKRIRRGSTPEHISIVSDNPEFDTYDLPLEHIHAVALVIGLIRTE
jgi:phage repressor protein C with HTH and peptisase S24 domain